MNNCDICIVGGGSGGFGTTLAASRAGLKTVLIEQSGELGGNANRCGVNAWEPVAGGTGFPFEIYKRLKKIPYSVGIYGSGRHYLWDGLDEIGGGESIIRQDKRYVDTMVRHGMNSIREDEFFARNNLFGIVFEPAVYAEVIEEMLKETGNCEIFFNTSFTEVVKGETGSIQALKLSNGELQFAKFFVDSTGDADLCREAGCDLTIGQESWETYHETSAPEKENNRINGVSLIFRISPIKHKAIEPLPQEIPQSCWWAANYPITAMVYFPNGDINMNILPTMQGEEFFSMSYQDAYAECKKRIFSWWHNFQHKYPEFQRFKIRSFSPDIGVRESYRVIGEYVLTEQDIAQGIKNRDFTDTIAIADHAMDRHGEDGGCKELKEPYAIPLRCLIPKGYKNLLVACRAASFSSIAATSCRLSRTIMQLGQGAGNAIALAVKSSCALNEISHTLLRKKLEEQHVQLTWPMSETLQTFVRNEISEPNIPVFFTTRNDQ